MTPISSEQPSPFEIPAPAPPPLEKPSPEKLLTDITSLQQDLGTALQQLGKDPAAGQVAIALSTHLTEVLRAYESARLAPPPAPTPEEEVEQAPDIARVEEPEAEVAPIEEPTPELLTDPKAALFERIDSAVIFRAGANAIGLIPRQEQGAHIEPLKALAAIQVLATMRQLNPDHYEKLTQNIARINPDFVEFRLARLASSDANLSPVQKTQAAAAARTLFPDRADNIFDRSYPRADTRFPELSDIIIKSGPRTLSELTVFAAARQADPNGYQEWIGKRKDLEVKIWGAISEQITRQRAQGGASEHLIRLLAVAEVLRPADQPPLTATPEEIQAAAMEIEQLALETREAQQTQAEETNKDGKAQLAETRQRLGTALIDQLLLIQKVPTARV